MKLITLNTWGGKIKEPLLNFIESNKDTDVFCFQEIWNEAQNKIEKQFDGINPDLFNDISSILSSHDGYFCPTVGDHYGIATFIKKDFKLKAMGDIVVYYNPDYTGGSNHSRKMFWIDIEYNNKNFSILNIHGLWTGQGKIDNPDRIEQSKKIREFVDSVKGQQILCGDFNLLPDTESVAILEKGMQNLIKEYNIENTRTSLYTRAETSGKHADYIFTSLDINVKDFKVLPDEVSDHSPLYIEFE